MSKKGMTMLFGVFYQNLAGRMKPFALLAAALIAAVVVLPQDARAHMLQGNKGPVNAFNYTEGLLVHLNSDCAQAFECQHNDVKDDFLFNCYYDVQSGECQCSKGDFSKCNTAKSSLDAKTIAALQGKGKKSFPLSLALGIAKPFVALAGLFSSLPLIAKIAAGVILVVGVGSLILRLRDTLSNNLRKARSFHDQATALHEQGQEEDAKLMFEKANYYREHAYEQQQNRV